MLPIRRIHLTVSPEQLAEHIAEMNIVATNAMQNIAKATRRAERHVYGNGDEIGEDSEVGDWGVLGQRGRGGLGDAEPEGLVMHRPVPSSGAQRLCAESDVSRRDRCTVASAALSAELQQARPALKATRRHLEEILMEKPEEDDEDVNQRTWARQDARKAGRLDGSMMQTATMSDIIGIVGGKGSKSLPVEKLEKSALALAKSARAAISEAAAAGDLTLNEELGLDNMCNLLMQSGNVPGAAQELARILSGSDQRTEDFFGG
jgi:hypothetical protein